MKRRKFIQNSLFATAAITTIPTSGMSQNLFSNENKFKFKLKFAPHIGRFKHHAGPDVLDQLQFMIDQGFTAFEDNEMRNRSPETQEKIARLMQGNNIEMGVFVAHKIYWKEPNLASGKKEYRDEFLKDIEDSINVAKRVNAKWMTVVPGHVDLKKDLGFQTTNVIETLKRASNMLEPHGITMVLEPLNFRDHPGLFLKESPQAYQICKAVNSPSCKILFDIYHQQIQEGNLIPNIEACWDEIAYFQIGDNPGRNEPSTGEINYKNVFKYIHNKGYNGILGMEHGNSIAGKEGEQKVIKAYQESTNF
ncbi:TIM barrel protein [Flavobacteriaceae bacterium S0862]|nr:TIM barrel protein [Flavobacteriaceae bacterium S0862]